MKPSFIHLGPQRCGTTSLYKALQHLQCVPNDVKEIQFFDRHFDLGLQWYFKHFEQLNTKSVVGEISPSYFDNPQAVERIRQCLPEVKIICTLRNPLSRILSYYRLLRMYNKCPEGIENAWEVSAELRDCCMYSEKLAKWQSVFDKDHFCIMFFDDLKKSPESYLAQFCSFVGITVPSGLSKFIPGPEVEAIPRFPLLNDLAARIGMVLRRKQLYVVLELLRSVARPIIFTMGAPKYRLEMSESFKTIVCDYYRNEIDKLAHFCDRDLSSWLSVS